LASSTASGKKIAAGQRKGGFGRPFVFLGTLAFALAEKARAQHCLVSCGCYTRTWQRQKNPFDHLHMVPMRSLIYASVRAVSRFSR
jgi:hypothetical protein